MDQETKAELARIVEAIREAAPKFATFRTVSGALVTVSLQEIESVEPLEEPEGASTIRMTSGVTHVLRSAHLEVVSMLGNTVLVDVEPSE